MRPDPPLASLLGEAQRPTGDGYRSRITGGWLAGYFLTAFGITWGLAVVAAGHLLPFAVPAVVRSMAAILLHYGPTLAAVLLVGFNGGKKALAEFARSLGRWRAGGFWWVFLFAFPVLVRLGAVGLDVALGGTFPRLMSAGGVPDGNPLLLIPVVFVGVFFQAGLAEEPGWRGYALPGLQNRWGAVTSSVVLSLFWCVWHFHPMNFPRLWPIAPWYVLNIIPFTILLTWIYNNTGQSLLMAALFHTVSNVCDWMIPTSSIGGSAVRPLILQGALTWAVALTVIVLYGARTLISGPRRRPARAAPPAGD
jgi:uncharacterized protein